MSIAVSDNADDGGFHVKYCASLVDTAAGDGDDAMSACFIMFDHLPDLTGKVFVSASLTVHCGTVVELNNHDHLDRIYIGPTANTAWSEASAHGVLSALSLGADIGIDIEPTADTDKTIDVSDRIGALYAADPDMPTLTVKLANAYWVGALTPDATVADLEVGDRGGADGYVELNNRAEANYPYLTIAWTDGASAERRYPRGDLRGVQRAVI